MSEFEEIISNVTRIEGEKRRLESQIANINSSRCRLSNEIIAEAKEMATMISRLPPEFQEELKSQLSILAVRSGVPI